MTERVQLKYQYFITCPMCGDEFYNLTNHIIHHHKLSIDAFRERSGYSGPIISPGHHRVMLARSQSSPIRQTDEYQQNINSKWHAPEVEEKRLANLRLSIASRASQKSSHSIALSDLREQLYQRAESKCEDCGISEEEVLLGGGKKLHLHHKNYDRIIPLLEDVELLCASCHKKHHHANKVTDRFAAVSRSVGDLLVSLGVDLQDENFVETPRRFARYLLDHFDDTDFEEQLEEFEGSVFPSEYSGIIMQSVSAVGMCPHHLLPVIYTGVVGYIPQAVTIGLSKLSRIAQSCLRRPILQEFGTLLVADSLSEVAKTPHVAVMLRGKHMCMTIRGVKAHQSSTVTSELRGDFYSDKSTRAEYTSLLRDLGRDVS